MVTTRFSQTASERVARHGTGSWAWNQPEASRWKSFDESRSPRPQLRRQRGQDLQASRRDHRPQAELGGGTGHAGQEDGLGLVGREAGQPRAVAIDEPDAAVRPAFGVDGHASLGQGVDVAQHRAHGDLEVGRQLRGGQLATGLEQQQQRDQA